MATYYPFLFHYNDYTKLWAAFRRVDERNYWDKMYPHEGTKAVFHENVEVLFSIIHKGEFPPPNTTTIYKLNH